VSDTGGRRPPFDSAPPFEPAGETRGRCVFASYGLGAASSAKGRDRDESPHSLKRNRRSHGLLPRAKKLHQRIGGSPVGGAPGEPLEVTVRGGPAWTCAAQRLIQGRPVIRQRLGETLGKRHPLGPRGEEIVDRLPRERLGIASFQFLSESRLSGTSWPHEADEHEVALPGRESRVKHAARRDEPSAKSRRTFGAKAIPAPVLATRTGTGIWVGQPRPRRARTFAMVSRRNSTTSIVVHLRRESESTRECAFSPFPYPSVDPTLNLTLVSSVSSGAGTDRRRGPVGTHAAGVGPVRRCATSESARRTWGRR
jgi:hypothetical protein